MPKLGSVSVEIVWQMIASLLCFEVVVGIVYRMWRGAFEKRKTRISPLPPLSFILWVPMVCAQSRAGLFLGNPFPTFGWWVEVVVSTTALALICVLMHFGKDIRDHYFTKS